MKALLCGLALSVSSGQAAPEAGSPAKENSRKGVETRFLTEAEKKNRVGEQRKLLIVAGRKTGPFGLSQDLTRKKITEKKPERVVKSDAFAKAVGALKVQMVSVSEQSFYIGIQEFKKGKVFSLDAKPNKFKVKVTSVTHGQISFENVSTGEVVIRKSKNLPAGMSRGSGANIDDVDGVSRENNQVPEVKIRP